MMEQPVFKRKLYDKMLQWKMERNGATALLIKGARRVGKSTIVEEFAKREYDSYILIDFVECRQEVKDLFSDISDLDRFFLRLQFLYNVQLIDRKSVIIFDEVQNCPLARQAIKKLVKDRRYDYIETGSLLSIKRNTKGIRIPSEETKLTLYPMDFEEFYWARGNDVTVPMLRKAWNNKMPLGDAVNRKIMDDLRLYMVIGGMPQAVNAYLETNNLSLIDAVKREIIELYADDFRKIDPSGRATSLFYAIPAQLSGNASRYLLSSVIEYGKVDRLSETLQNMEDSMTVLISRHANDPSVGLSMHKDINKFKMFINDTGLMVTMAFWDKTVTENEIYQKLLTGKLPVNLGYVYENLVAQMLKAGGDELFYHTWRPDGGKHNYEVDFLISRGSKLCPIEVKSSGYRTHKSLDEFCNKYSSRIGQRYLIYTKDLRKEGKTLYLPFYFTGLI